MVITPMVSTMSIMTFAEDGNDLQVFGLGLSVILLNVGMYVGVPAMAGLAAHKYRKEFKPP